jgi:hypothetical protein
MFPKLEPEIAAAFFAGCFKTIQHRLLSAFCRVVDDSIYQLQSSKLFIFLKINASSLFGLQELIMCK